MLRTAALLALTALALAAPTAPAADRAELPVMLQVAEAGLGAGVCGDRLEVEFVEADSLGTVDGYQIAGRGANCHITLAGGYFDRAGWVWACHLVAHEYGHAALALNHVDDPDALMYGGPPTVQWAPCLNVPAVLAKEAEADHYDGLAERYEHRSERLDMAWGRAYSRSHYRHARSLNRRAAACARAAARLRARAAAIRPTA